MGSEREKSGPPKWAIRVLSWFCPPALYETIEGDLIEQFEIDVLEVGLKKARKRFLWNAIKFIRPAIMLRNRYSLRTNSLSMVGSYFKIAYRHLANGKSIALIHVLGLTVGITAFLLIIQYLSFELSYDRFQANQNEIYRVVYQQYENGAFRNASAKNFQGLTSLLGEQFPEVKASTGFDRTAEQAYFLFVANGRKYYQQGSFYQADSNFFRVFPSMLFHGDPETVLDDPHHLVLSEKMAKQIFGESNPIGKRIENKSPSYSDVTDFVISGIMKEIPENSHFHLNFIARNTHADELALSNYWKGPQVYTYLTLSSHADPVAIANRLNLLLNTLERENPKTKGVQVFLQSVGDIHLHSNLQDELEPNGSIMLIYILSAVGIVILLLAWINFINIETARFISRTREVGVRRMMGSGKGDLALQFLVEYFCISLVALTLAWSLLYCILPQFSYLIGVPIKCFQWKTPTIWIEGFGLFLAGSIITGIYPALFLMKIRPMDALKGNPMGVTGTLTRKSLILVQFTCSVALMTFLLVINGQLDYMQLTNKKLDLDKVISLRNPTVYANEDDSVNFAEYSALENKLLHNSLIKSVTTSSAIPGMEVDETFTNRLKRNLADPDNQTRYKILFVDYNFIPFYDIKLMAGRNYSLVSGDEENWNTVVLNESAIHALGYESVAEAIDQEIHFHLWGGEFKKYKIVGIVEDYHHESIKKAVYPTVLSLNHSRFQQVFYSVKLNAGSNPQDGLAHIEKSWKETFPDKPFEYFFQDDYYDRQFRSELHFGRIFTLFAGVAVLIAILGVLGMTLFESNRRLKEISIRRVLGATASNLVALLSKDYLKLISLAVVISAPVVYYAASEWLTNYPSKIEISIRFFFMPLVVMIALGILTSGFQIIKAANTNPVDHLKND